MVVSERGKFLARFYSTKLEFRVTLGFAINILHFIIRLIKNKNETRKDGGDQTTMPNYNWRRN